MMEREHYLDSASFGEIIAKQLVMQNLNLSRLPSDKTVGRKEQPPTISLSHQQRFARAVYYAKANMDDAEYAAAAEVYGDRSAFSIAHRDFMRSPKIVGINLRRYTGTSGDPITTITVDDFKVTKVTFDLIVSETVIEHGNATLLSDGLTWRYLGSTTVTSGEVKIVCKAFDKAGNITESTETICL
jgi:hypothetical protein